MTIAMLIHELGKNISNWGDRDRLKVLLTVHVNVFMFISSLENKTVFISSMHFVIAQNVNAKQ